MNKSILFIYLFSLFIFPVFSQDAFLSNTGQSRIYLNPSYAGTNGYVRILSAFRLQDMNLSVPMKTGYASVDAFIKPIKAGIALSYLYDDQKNAKLKSNAFSLVYGQHLYLYDKKMRLIPAIQATYFNRTLASNDLKVIDTIDYRKNDIWDSRRFTTFPSASSATKSNADISASVLLQSKDVNFGVAVFHLNQPDQGIWGVSKLPYRINLHGSYNFSLTEELNLSVFALFISQKDFKDLLLSANFNWNNEFFFGLGMRKANALTANIGFQSGSVRFSVGYDYGLNAENTYVYGKNSIELMLSFNLKNKVSENSPFADWKTW